MVNQVEYDVILLLLKPRGLVEYLILWTSQSRTNLGVRDRRLYLSSVLLPLSGYLREVVCCCAEAAVGLLRHMTCPFLLLPRRGEAF